MFNPDSLAATADIEIVPTPKRVRARVANTFIADTQDAVLLRRRNRPPEYLLPWKDVKRDAFQETDRATSDEHTGNAIWYRLRVDDREVQDGALAYTEPAAGLAVLGDYVKIAWDAVDAWFEEDEQIDVHPRDPRHRIDVRPSSREVTVHVNGEVIAHSTRPTMLFETGLNPRYYLPRMDVRWEFLEPSDTQTGCPYKGWATYHSIRVGDRSIEDGVWSYRFPRPEATHIANLVCFYDERMDAFDVELR